ncbi:MAG: hypothetical protein AAGM22_27935 [Acidobacteriota bacterium]
MTEVEPPEEITHITDSLPAAIEVSRVYEIFCDRIQHLEKLSIGTIVVLVTLTGAVLNPGLVEARDDAEYLILFLPFAILVTSYYGLFLRISIIETSLGNIEKSERLDELAFNYFSGRSQARKLTFLFVNAQCATPFLFVPLERASGASWSSWVAVSISVAIVALFTVALARAVYRVN